MAFEFSPNPPTAAGAVPDGIDYSATQDFTHGPVNDGCPFCVGFESQYELFDIGQPLGSGNVVLKPALGMMLPGYFLGVTENHLTSFAQLDNDKLAEVDETLAFHEKYLGSKFGQYFRLEHGSDNITDCGSGGCIEHAHQHLIPSPVSAELIKDELPWEQLDTYADLADFRGQPYIYLGHLGLHYAVANPSLPSQWVRRKVAEAEGLEEWDWAMYHGVDELMSTFWAIRNFPRGRVIWKPESDVVEWLPKGKQGPR
jgi:hypothetical protein